MVCWQQPGRIVFGPRIVAEAEQAAKRIPGGGRQVKHLAGKLRAAQSLAVVHLAAKGREIRRRPIWRSIEHDRYQPMYLSGKTPTRCSPALLPPARSFPPNATASTVAIPPMPSPPLTSRELVNRLDARHDELIARLDELNAQIEAALAEFGHSRETAAAPGDSKRPRRAA